MEGKRTYTVPVLLILLTALSILLVLSYSKLLLSEQMQKVEHGRLLAEQYEQASIFANRLQDGADALLQGSAADRAHAAWLLGGADGTKQEALRLLLDAAERSDPPSPVETGELQAAFDALFADADDALNRLALQAEPLSADQTAWLQAVRDGAASMNESLGRFRVPTLDSGFRSMAAGAEWVAPALEAGQALIGIASHRK